MIVDVIDLAKYIKRLHAYLTRPPHGAENLVVVFGLAQYDKQTASINHNVYANLTYEHLIAILLEQHDIWTHMDYIVPAPTKYDIGVESINDSITGATGTITISQSHHQLFYNLRHLIDIVEM